jgi:hypothetical protein
MGVTVFPIKFAVSETSCSLEYQMMEKVQKLSNSVCYTPSSELFRIIFILQHSAVIQTNKQLPMYKFLKVTSFNFRQIKFIKYDSA